MAYHYNTRARARSDVEPDDISQGDLDVEMTTAIVPESAIVGYQVESVEGLESQPTEVAGSVTTHPQLLPEEATPPWVGMEVSGLSALPRWGLPWDTPADTQTHIAA